MHIAHTRVGARGVPAVTSSVEWEAVPLYPTGHLLDNAILPSPGDVTALLNTYKQTQKGCKNEETKKYVLNKTDLWPRYRYR